MGACCRSHCVFHRGSSKKAIFWRSLARRFQETASLLARLNPSNCSIIVRHLVKAWDALARFTATDDANAAANAWLHAMTGAVTTMNGVAVLQLVKVADLAAHKAETSARHAQSKAWRDRLRNETNSRRRNPSRQAFRWIKDLATWTPNPVGDQLANDDIPCERDWDVEFGDLPQGVSSLERCRLYTSFTQSNTVPLCDQASIEKEANS